ncbi:MAG: phytanoyl-CoA dioxygenase family protein [Burkholderiales bacterium]|nr:phytanoyl-CoA dioxygenase family protein [Burkholderiales bacterium]
MDHGRFLSGAQRAALREQGYVCLPGLMPAAMLDAMRRRVEALAALEGERAGSEFKPEPGALRLANCVDKGEVFREAIVLPAVLEAVAEVLGPHFKLSSLNVRTALPMNGIDQPLHRDMGAVPDAQGDWVCNCIWMLDDFTADNGPTRAVPGSHRLRDLPADPRARHPDEVHITGSAGTVVVMNAHLWHGGLANRTARPRAALHSFFCRADKPQQQYQKRLLRPETQAALSPQLRRLLALDDPENDRMSADVAVTSGFLK